MNTRVEVENPRLSETVFNQYFKQQSFIATELDHYGLINEVIPQGEFRSYIDPFNRQYVLLSTLRGNVLVSRVKDRRNEGQWCFRVLYSTNSMGSFTKVKQNSSVTGSELAKILGYQCDNLHQRFVTKEASSDKRFPW